MPKSKGFWIVILFGVLFLIVMYTSTRNLSGAPRSVEVRDGRALVGMDFQLRKVAAFCLRGDVRNAEGVPAVDVGVTLERDGQSTGMPCEHGRFLFTGLTPGVYTIVVKQATGGRLAPELAREEIRVRGAQRGDRVVIRIK